MLHEGRLDLGRTQPGRHAQVSCAHNPFELVGRAVLLATEHEAPVVEASPWRHADHEVFDGGVPLPITSACAWACTYPCSTRVLLAMTSRSSSRNPSKTARAQASRICSRTSPGSDAPSTLSVVAGPRSMAYANATPGSPFGVLCVPRVAWIRASIPPLVIESCEAVLILLPAVEIEAVALIKRQARAKLTLAESGSAGKAHGGHARRDARLTWTGADASAASTEVQLVAELVTASVVVSQRRPKLDRSHWPVGRDPREVSVANTNY